VVAIAKSNSQECETGQGHKRRQRGNDKAKGYVRREIVQAGETSARDIRLHTVYLRSPLQFKREFVDSRIGQWYVD